MPKHNLPTLSVRLLQRLYAGGPMLWSNVLADGARTESAARFLVAIGLARVERWHGLHLVLTADGRGELAARRWGRRE
jgi:hypothetical protein